MAGSEDDPPLPLGTNDEGPLVPSPAGEAPPIPSGPPGGGSPASGLNAYYEQLLDPSGAGQQPVSGGGLQDLLVGPLRQFGGAGPPTAGQGFRFDPEGASELIKQIDAVIEEEVEVAVHQARRLIVEPPAVEDSSRSIAEIANTSGASYNEYIQATLERLRSFRDALVNVRDGKLAQDQEIEDIANKG
jgi:hypothetical protein